MRLAQAIVILATQTLRWTFPDHRAALDDCYALGDSLQSLDSIRIERQLVGSNTRIVLLLASARGLEGTLGSLVVRSDTNATVWIWCKASRSPWGCSSNPAGIGTFPVSVPPGAAARESILVDVSGRAVSGKRPWGTNWWRVPRRARP